MRRFLPALILVCVAGVGGLYLFFHSSSERSVSPETSATTSSSPSTSLEPNQTAAAVAHTSVTRIENNSSISTVASAALPPPIPFLLGSPDSSPPMDPATVLSNMRIAVNQYGSIFGGNPVGSNSEITKALNGGNAKEVKFLSEESGLRINGRGELVDYWAHPSSFTNSPAPKWKSAPPAPTAKCGPPTIWSQND